MLRLPCALCFAALLSGCTDSLGIGLLGCTLEQQRVRQSEGRPPDETHEDEIGGNQVVQWLYRDPPASVRGREYTFRWGPSHDGCEVSGPVRFYSGGEHVDVPA